MLSQPSKWGLPATLSVLQPQPRHLLSEVEGGREGWMDGVGAIKASSDYSIWGDRPGRWTSSLSSPLSKWSWRRWLLEHLDIALLPVPRLESCKEEKQVEETILE